LSSDEHGRAIRAHLEHNGVDLSAAVDAAEPTPVAEVGVGADGGPTYDFRVAGAADWQWTDDELAPVLERVAHIHSGSMAVTQPPGGAAVRRLLAQAAHGWATVSYDPNCRPALMGDVAQVRPLVEGLVADADIVKVSGEDLSWLYPGDDAADVVSRWQASGPAFVVLTLGPDGAYAVTDAGTVERPGRPVTVVDTVGAGDSFMAALLAGLHRAGLLGGTGRSNLRAVDEDQLGEALDLAIRVSAITCSRRGADPPTLAELR
jgi:fructokinase